MDEGTSAIRYLNMESEGEVGIFHTLTERFLLLTGMGLLS